MRCAGTDNVALDKAKELKLEVTSVPAYSPYSVAEMAISLMLV
jgi:D-lactate dehydrogenase